MKVAFGLFFVLFSATAWAQYPARVAVPCAKYIEASGHQIDCEQFPKIYMTEAQWEEMRTRAEERNSPEAQLPPWERAKNKAAAPQERTQKDIDLLCDLPPWKRPRDLQCPAKTSEEIASICQRPAWKRPGVQCPQP